MAGTSTAKPTEADDALAAQATVEADDIHDVTVIDGEAVEVDADGDPVEATPEQAEALVAAEHGAEVVLREREQPHHVPAVLPSAVEWEASLAIAERIAGTPFVPQAYRGQPEAVLAAILYGREIGVGPMQALQKIHMIDGKPSMSAELMLAQLRRGGVVILGSESTRERAMIHARRSDTGEEATVEWTIEEARGITTRERGQTITLDQKSNWQAFPSDMLWARCVGRLARRLGSDLLGGITYAAEEMQDWDEGGYGGDGYDTTTTLPQPEAKAATTSDGVELRADAPRGWTAIMEALKQIDAGMPWAEWVSQASAALCGKSSFTDLTDGERVDVGIRVANGVAHLIVALDGREMPPSRSEVRGAFAHPDSVGEVLEGPARALDPDEAAAQKAASGHQEASDAPEAPGAATEPSDAQEASDAPLGPTAPVDESDLPPFGEEGP